MPCWARWRASARRRALHVEAGRLLLAHAPCPLQAEVPAARLPRYTKAVRTEHGFVAAELERIRERGWLITHGEVVDGAVSVSAPVRGLCGEAALAILSPATRMRPPRPRSLVPDLLEAAAALSAALMPGPPRRPY